MKLLTLVLVALAVFAASSADAGRFTSQTCTTSSFSGTTRMARADI
jgi:hypothetical protein